MQFSCLTTEKSSSSVPGISLLFVRHMSVCRVWTIEGPLLLMLSSKVTDFLQQGEVNSVFQGMMAQPTCGGPRICKCVLAMWGRGQCVAHLQGNMCPPPSTFQNTSTLLRGLSQLSLSPEVQE